MPSLEELLERIEALELSNEELLERIKGLEFRGDAIARRIDEVADEKHNPKPKPPSELKVQTIQIGREKIRVRPGEAPVPDSLWHILDADNPNIHHEIFGDKCWGAFDKIELYESEYEGKPTRTLILWMRGLLEKTKDGEPEEGVYRIRMGANFEPTDTGKGRSHTAKSFLMAMEAVKISDLKQDIVFSVKPGQKSEKVVLISLRSMDGVPFMHNDDRSWTLDVEKWEESLQSAIVKIEAAKNVTTGMPEPKQTPAANSVPISKPKKVIDAPKKPEPQPDDEVAVGPECFIGKLRNVSSLATSKAGRQFVKFEMASEGRLIQCLAIDNFDDGGAGAIATKISGVYHNFRGVAWMEGRWIKKDGSEIFGVSDLCAYASEPEGVDISSLIEVEMKRIGWTGKQAVAHMAENYGKKTRADLEPEELLEFLEHLESLPDA